MKKKEERQSMEAARRSEKIRQAEENIAQRLREAVVFKLLTTKDEYKTLSDVQKVENDIVEHFVNSIPKGLKMK
jgi:hypothetical protein